MNIAFRLGLAASVLAGSLLGSSLLVGSDGSGPVQLIASDGTLLGTFGQADGTVAADDANGDAFVATPGADSSTIDVYGPTDILLNSFSFIAPDDLSPDASYVIDMATGLADTFWVSTYTGEVYNLSADGSVLSYFDTGTLAPGVAFDGVDLYTSSGPSYLSGGPFIYERDTSGNIVNVIDSGLSDTLGLGYDMSSQTLWVGGFDLLSQIDLQGDLLQSLPIDGTHYGVDVQAPVAGTPEPYTWVLTLTALLGLVAWKSRPFRGIAAGLVCAAVVAPMMQGAITISSFTPSPAGPQPVGTPITFTAVASDTDAGGLRYRFEYRPAGGAWTMVSDYSSNSAVVWSPSATDGTYEIEVSVLNRTTLNTETTSTFYTVSARTSGGTPVVTPTAHPLVALYSAPSCATGSTMRVRFKLPSDTLWTSTPLEACNGSTSMNFYIAGMRASSTYQLRQDTITGPSVVSGPILTFTTGAISITIPSTDAILPMKAPSSMTEGVMLFGGLDLLGYPPYAVDSNLNVIWYATTTQVYLTRPVPGGDYMVTYGFNTDLVNSGLREYDLVGNLVKETNIERMNDQLTAMGMSTATAFHHEIRKLSNGGYLVLAMKELASSIQGPPNDIAGDMILVLDSNLQLQWAWDSFAHLDVTRAAVLGETCVNSPAQCVLFNSSSAHDWTHGNAASITPDGNILYSSRHQDMAYKIAYQNGTGDGHVIWRLGRGGDFTWLSSDPYPWFSHQHDVEYEDAATISLFDNGNTRITQNGGNSRGQGLRMDETNMIVTPLLNVDLGGYSNALGSAQRLLNGDYAWGNHWISATANTQCSEWSSSGAPVANLHSVSVNYRSWRLRDLYSAPY